MNRKHHIILALFMFFAWAAFYVIGIPSDYYTTWTTDAHILLTLLAVFAIVPVLGSILLVLLPGKYLKNSFWIAFYASVIPFVMDFLLVGLMGGKGFSFLISHWFLSLAYIYVWIELPILGLSFQQFQRRLSEN